MNDEMAATKDIEITRRANVEGLNKAAMDHYNRESLTVGQELFISLLKGDDKDIEDKLYHYVYGVEYWATDGGEPDLTDVLAIKLLEKLRGQKMYMSMIYSDEYLEHVGIKDKGDVKG